MTDYSKKMKGRSARRMAMGAFWLFLVAALFLVFVFFIAVPQDDTLYESYADFPERDIQPFHLRLDSYDVVDWVWEERTFTDHVVLFLYQEDGSTFNVILSEGKFNSLAENGFLNTTVYNVGSSEASSYADSLVEYFNGQDLSEEEMNLYRQLSRSPYYTTPFDQASHAGALVFGLFMLVMGLLSVGRAVAASRGGGAYGQDLLFIAGGAGIRPEEVEERVRQSFNDPDKATYITKNLVSNRDFILAYGNDGPRLMRPEDLVWMYRHTLTQRVYGFRAGTQHSVVLYAQDSHKPVNVPAKNQDEADRSFFELQRLCPKAFVGYDKSMLKQAKKKNYHTLITAWNAQQTASVQTSPIGTSGDAGEHPGGAYSQGEAAVPPETRDQDRF